MIRVLCLLLILFIKLETEAYGGLHHVPIILSAKQLRTVQFYPVGQYRVFRTDPNGTAIAIPFQIDQKDRYTDYVLEKGKNPNTKGISAVFSGEDELCLMGDDVGIKKVPTKWVDGKPDILYEVEFSKEGDKSKEGHAIYIGVYNKNPPPLSKESYVRFDLDNAEIVSSKFRYHFNSKNYIVVKGVDIEKGEKREEQIILSSSVFMLLDLKYFLTLKVGDSNIESELDAYKTGPIRTIARVNFDFKLSNLKIKMDMYTEVSFFRNSVILPAVIENPIDGKRILNKGSYFYYGLAVDENPKGLKPKSNMPPFEGKGTYESVSKKANESQYWTSAQSPKDYSLYLEFQPSTQMEKDGNVPNLYIENVAKDELIKRENKPLPLGDSPVNVAVSFGLNNFHQGIHQVRFRVFIENQNSDGILDEFRNSGDWKVAAQRLP